MSEQAAEMLDYFCSVSEAADIAGVSQAYVRLMAAKGQINAKRVGGRWLILRDEVSRFVRIGRGPSIAGAYCSITEACRIAGVSDGYMRRLVRDGKIEAVKVGAGYLVSRASVEQFERTPGMGRPRSNEQSKTLHDETRQGLALKRYRVIPSERWYVLGRDKETCVYCGWSRGSSFGRPGDIHVDHIIPFSRGGSSTRENLVCACVQCNLYKGDRTPEEAGMQMKFLGPSLEYAFGSIFQSLKGA